ncbi:nitroreductase family protein [Williamsia sp. 1135]|uniref:Acg family FMN-binding oxidoreductase n=1 Tax=Williamsia sp. 1135 TaxID=1889262 RepID=UPI000A0F414C|nr:nitroreductase family protein [Williamsia sp. 1135]ORM36779.1 hypothetical protein BFL43_06135 [Williamsia sp. 1135]
MSQHLPDPATITSAAELALRAPSVHNSQPWRIRVSTGSVHLYADPDLHLMQTDPDGRDLYVSCGIMLHHMRIALEALGWRAEVTRLPITEDPYHIASLALHPHNPSEHVVALAAAIPRRRSDRRWYSSWPVPEAHLATLGKRAAAEGVVLDRAQMSTFFRRAAVTAAEAHAKDPLYQDEMALWSGNHRIEDGVPGANVPASPAPADDSSRNMPTRAFAAPSLEQTAHVESDDDAGVLLLVSTPGDDRASQVRAGEAASAILLEATAMGLATCAFTEPLELPHTRRLIQQHVSSTHSFPQLIIRTGWAPMNADPLPPTPRRPVTAVVVGIDSNVPVT